MNHDMEHLDLVLELNRQAQQRREALLHEKERTYPPLWLWLALFAVGILVMTVNDYGDSIFTLLLSGLVSF